MLHSEGTEHAWHNENVKDVGKVFTHYTAAPTSTQSTEASVSIAARPDLGSPRKSKVKGIDTAPGLANLNGTSASNRALVHLTIVPNLLG